MAKDPMMLSAWMAKQRACVRACVRDVVRLKIGGFANSDVTKTLSACRKVKPNVT
jgi:hypothetical protein